MRLLLPLSWIYGGIMALRNWMFNQGLLKQVSFPLPVISIGNLAVGGTGKTPHTEYLLTTLGKEGFRCAMLSRGYGRKTKGYYEGQGKSPQEIGDEPWQVQQKYRKVRVCVCENRVLGINEILRQGEQPEVILLDDAYQHRYVKPGLSILLTDFSRPYHSDHVLPAGRLREFKCGAARAHIIIVTKCPKNLSTEKSQKIKAQFQLRPYQQIFFTYFDYGPLYAFNNPEEKSAPKVDLKEEKILLFCGIARPQPLSDYLRSLCKEVKIRVFSDHHNFTGKEIDELNEEAQQYDRIVTTEKDAARLSGYALPPTLQEHLWVQPIEVKFLNQDTNKFNKIIKDYVTENQRNR